MTAPGWFVIAVLILVLWSEACERFSGRASVHGNPPRPPLKYRAADGRVVQR